MLKKVFNRLVRWWSEFTGDSTPAVGLHQHDWRNITDHFRQCRDRKCGLVQQMTGNDIPEGMQDYIDLMTTEAARLDPKGEASRYAIEHYAYGPQCSVCGRGMVLFETPPANALVAVYYCPYCGAGVQRGPTGAANAN